MKSKEYLNLLGCLLAFALLTVTFGCTKDDPPPPPVVVNQPPVISGLNDLTLSPGFETHEIDFANFVTDQEGEIITYDVTNSDESVITISLDNSVLTISEVDAGSSDITVNATDGNAGHDVSATFTVTVEPITGAPDFTGTAAYMIDFNGLGTGSIFDNPVDNFLVEGWGYDWETGDFGTMELANDDHLVITNDVDSSWIWVEIGLDGNQDFTGKKLRFDYSYFTAPALNDIFWEDDPSGIDIEIWVVDESWGAAGGLMRFSGLALSYSTEWQTVEIPLSDFTSLWDLPVDPSQVANFGMQMWGGTSSDPISFRIDNFGIVD